MSSTEEKQEPRGWKATPVSEIMRGEVLCVRAGSSVGELADLVLTHAIGGAPVVDDRDVPIGMVSKTDLVRAAYGRAGGKGRPEVGEGTNVEQIMTPVVLSVPPDAQVGEVADLMARGGMHRVLVVGADGEVVGILSTMEIVRWLAQVSVPANG